ncbi:MAG: alpha/beta hydrolase [Hydrogenovibrio sp.]|uniref:alpha/beta hydrolase n=1 Tax=Hydrogenovibrio sp. TaxID=2065821 RepID=UPI002870338D|nr:alpha/beta hydrolase [Hydrogenovibrio sp.]MDR9498047.1 alpha/beta hydrolase [Hydrogenovibrio sp.]
MQSLKYTRRLAALALGSVLSLSTWAVQAEEKEVKQTLDGQTLNANLTLSDNGYQGDVVLLLHGTLTHNERSTYAQLQNNLKAYGMTSLAINLSLGVDDRHGEYDCATTHTHKHTDALKELDLWMGWLEDKGAENITLMGHSRGGNQAAWYASQAQRPSLKHLVLIAPATGEQQSPADYKKKYGVALDSVLDKAEALVKQGKGDEVMKGVDFIYCEDTNVTAEAFVDYYAQRPQFDTPTLLQNPVVPTLVIMGSEDNVVADLPEKIAPVAEQQDLVTTVTLDGADHFFRDFFNEDIAIETEQFIQP